MKEVVALMRVNPFPLFYTTRRHALCVKVGNSRRAFIFALVANAKLNPRYSHLADIDRRERSEKIITLSRRTYRRRMHYQFSRRSPREDTYLRDARLVQREQ